MKDKTYNTIENEIANITRHYHKSAWNTGIKNYAYDLLEQLTESDFDDSKQYTRKELMTLLLNGASSWEQYSYGGSSLVYDSDIAERLCAPWELRKTDNGNKQPNSRETWLDVQARALFQAAHRVINAYKATQYK